MHTRQGERVGSVGRGAFQRLGSWVRDEACGRGSSYLAAAAPRSADPTPSMRAVRVRSDLPPPPPPTHTPHLERAARHRAPRQQRAQQASLVGKPPHLGTLQLFEVVPDTELRRTRQAAGHRAAVRAGWGSAAVAPRRAWGVARTPCCLHARLQRDAMGLGHRGQARQQVGIIRVPHALLRGGWGQVGVSSRERGASVRSLAGAKRRERAAAVRAMLARSPAGSTRR